VALNARLDIARIRCQASLLTEAGARRLYGTGGVEASVGNSIGKRWPMMVVAPACAAIGWVTMAIVGWVTGASAPVIASRAEASAASLSSRYALPSQ